MMQASKLELMQVLHRQGFMAVENPGRCWVTGGDNVYRLGGWSGSKLYFIALILREELMSRGAGLILHAGPAKYYSLLLQLKDLSALAGCALEDVQANVLDVLEKDKSLHEPLCDGSSHDDDDDSMQGASADSNFAVDDQQNGDLFVPVQLETYAAQQSQLVSYRCPVSEAYVHFDNHSHSSGLLRAYILCSTHSGCTKHAQVVTRGSRKNAIAYCLAWNEWGKSLSKQQHSGRDKVPPENLVQEILSRL